MREMGRSVSIVMGDDDEDDCLVIKEALSESELNHTLRIIGSGREMIDYLRGRGRYEGLDLEYPDLILLDLHMPDLHGREVLKEIREDPDLSRLVVVVLTDSADWSDLLECYLLGSTAVFKKKEWLETFAEIIRIAGPYWFEYLTGQLGPGLRESHTCQMSGTFETDMHMW
jgi:CheY-like chemotaxis protein